MMIDNSGPGVIRSRHGKATASYYKKSKRIICVAFSASFLDLAAAVHELSIVVGEGENAMKGTNS